MDNNTLDKVRNWTNDDKSIATTFYVKKAMKKKGDRNPDTGQIFDHDETEDEFIKRVDEKIKRDRQDFRDRHSTLDKLSELPDMNLHYKFRRSANGKIFIDNSVKSQKEISLEKERLLAEQKKILDEKKAVLKTKILKNLTDLTEEDVDILLS